MAHVVPTLTAGLTEVCKEQPEDPIEFLAQYLRLGAPEEPHFHAFSSCFSPFCLNLLAPRFAHAQASLGRVACLQIGRRCSPWTWENEFHLRPAQCHQGPEPLVGDGNAVPRARIDA